MSNKNVKSFSIHILDKIQSLSDKINQLTEIIKYNTSSDHEIYAEISSCYSEILNLLNNNKGKYKNLEGLVLHYETKKKNFIKLWKIIEVKDCLDVREPEQKNKDMFINIITHCISACENLKKNNNLTLKTVGNNKNYINEGSRNEGSLNLDFDKLIGYYNELLECDEMSDFLYTEISSRTNELSLVYERLSDENDKMNNN